jgi:alpha-L-fucosidase 2
VKGLHARGGFEVDIAWKGGRLTSATVRSNSGAPCRVSYQGKTLEFKIQKGRGVTLNSRLEAE